MAAFAHQSVLLESVLTEMAPMAGHCYVDATFGGGGHSRALLEATAPTGQVLALDRDLDAIQVGEQLKQEYPTRFRLLHAPFSQLARSLELAGVERVAGVLFDLGVSSWQLDCKERGFSFREEGPLDMRMDTTATTTAAGLVNTLTVEALTNLFFEYGEERRARHIARIIVEDRQHTPFTTTRQLASLIERIAPGRPGGIHPATRVFQALRIAVNRELEELEQGLAAAMAALQCGGRVAVISFHSLEDRIVKRAFQKAAGLRSEVEQPPFPFPVVPVAPPTFRILTRKPLMADAAEMAANPRARSAKLRVAERVAEEVEPKRETTRGGGRVRS